MANTYKNIVITPNRDTDAANVPVIRFSGGDATTNTDINVRVYTTQSGTLSFEGSAGQLFSITNDLTNSIFSVNDVSGIPSIDVYANGNILLAPFGGQVFVGNTVNLNFDSTASTKIVDPAANTLAFHTAQTERMRIDNSGNVLIGRTTSTVGSGVKLDVAGAANASNILVNGNMVFTAANDGAGSNLDADLLDGQQGSYYGIATDVTAANRVANASFLNANAAFATANVAFANANTVMISAQAAFTVANASFLHANASYAFGNSAHSIANLAFTHANNAYAKANAALPNTSGVSFAGDLTIPTNLIVGSNVNFDTSLSTKIVEAAANTLAFHTAQTERVRIDATGNVGIGTSSPSALLHVSNPSAKIRIGVDASTQYTDIYRDNTTGYTIYNAAQAATFRGHIWQLGGTEAMRIDTGGNVLIGRTDSTMGQAIKLDVAGAANASAYLTGTGQAVLNNQTTLISTGYTISTFNAGANISSYGTWQPNASNSNYQVATANGAVTITTPPANCAIDILFVNASNRNPGAVSFTGYTVGASPGSTYAVTANQRYILSIRQINSISTYSWYAMQ